MDNFLVDANVANTAPEIEGLKKKKKKLVEKVGSIEYMYTIS